MGHFEEFCKATPKNKHGYMPDIIDLPSNAVKDWAVVSYLRDTGNATSASYFYMLSDAQKNEYYAKYESAMQDEVDKFNQAIDDERAKNLELIDDTTWIGIIDPDYKWQHFNQAMYDSGHKPSDFA